MDRGMPKSGQKSSPPPPMSQLDAVIVCPPWSQITAIAGPPLPPAQLAGYLSGQGMKSKAIDLSIRFACWIARPGGYLDQRLARAVEEVRLLTGRRTPAGPEERRRGLEALRYLSNVPMEILAPALAGREPPPEGNSWLLSDMPMIGPPWFYTVHFAAPPEIDCQSVSAAIADLARDDIFDEFFAAAEARRQIEQIAASKVVGISISFPTQIGAGLRLARLLRGRSDALIVLGGITLTIASDRERQALASLPFVDGVVVHAGELPLRRLVEVEGRRALLGSVPGLVYCDDGTIRTTPVGQRVPASDLPTPEFDEEAVALYPRGASLPVLVSRGCYWDRCTFCDERSLNHPGQPGFDARAADKVASDIRALVRQHAISRFSFITNAAPPSWCEAFARIAQATKLDIEFWTFLKNHRRDVYTPDFARRMKAAGMALVTFGVESFAPRVLDLMNKGSNEQDRIDNLRTLSAAGIAVHINMIPDFPGSLREDALEGLRVIIDNRDAIARISTLRFGLEPNTDISREPSTYGLEVVGDDGVSRRNLNFRRTGGMTETDRLEVLEAYDELEGWLALYHHTSRNRDRIARPDFVWEEAAFVFRAHAILEDGQSTCGTAGPIDFVIVPDLALFFEVPRVIAPFMRSLSEDHGMVLSFTELQSRYAACWPKARLIDRRQDLIAVLRHLVQYGLVKLVRGGEHSAVAPLAQGLIARGMVASRVRPVRSAGSGASRTRRQRRR